MCEMTPKNRFFFTANKITLYWRIHCALCLLATKQLSFLFLHKTIERVLNGQHWTPIGMPPGPCSMWWMGWSCRSRSRTRTRWWLILISVKPRSSSELILTVPRSMLLISGSRMVVVKVNSSSRYVLSILLRLDSLHAFVRACLPCVRRREGAMQVNLSAVFKIDIIFCLDDCNQELWCISWIEETIDQGPCSLFSTY